MINYSDYSDNNMVDDFNNETIDDVTVDFDEEIIDDVTVDHPIETHEVPDEKDDTKIMFVTANLLYLRKGPGSDFKEEKVLQKDDELLVDMTDEYADWYHVYTSSGVEGYVMKKFVEER